MIDRINESHVFLNLKEITENKEFRIKQDGSSLPFEDESGILKIKIKDLDIYKKLELDLAFDNIEINSFFEKYTLDKKKLNDEHYVTSKIINAATRNLNNNELFFTAFNALREIKPENHFHDALITLLSYKTLENPKGRMWIISTLEKSKIESQKDNNVILTPNIVRWNISSTASLSLLLLLNDLEESASNIINHTVNENSTIYNQLTFWNYTIIKLLQALIEANNNTPKKAGWTFLETFDFTRKAVNDLYHSRNDWILGQISDCRALIELGELALKCAVKCLGNIPHETRIANISFNGVIDLSPIFSRCRMARGNFNGVFFDEVTRKINEGQK